MAHNEHRRVPRAPLAEVGAGPARPGIARGAPSSFDTVVRDEREVLLGTDERHPDFRASVPREADRVVLSTVIRLHNQRGRAYFALVRPVHPVIVRAMPRRAARRLSARGHN